MPVSKHTFLMATATNIPVNITLNYYSVMIDNMSAIVLGGKIIVTEIFESYLKCITTSNFVM